MRCPSCGEENAERARFCSSCGAPLGEATALGGEERKVVSVLFVDLVGYTSLSERLDPEDVRDLLGHYFDAARRIVPGDEFAFAYRTDVWTTRRA